MRLPHQIFYPLFYHITPNISDMSFFEDNIGNFGIYTAASECTQAKEEHLIDINVTSDGDFFSESLIKLLSFQISCIKLRNC